MEDKKTDRRIRRTRKLLTDSLTTLMLTKPVQEISVKELTELADINRGTFYLHYHDVYDMLEQLYTELFDDFNCMLDAPHLRGEPLDPHKTLLHIFQFLYDRRNTVQALLGPNGDIGFMQRLLKLFKERMHFYLENYFEDSMQFEFYFSFITAGFTGLVQTWRNHDWTPSPAEMTAMAELLITQSPYRHLEEHAADQASPTP